TSNLNRMPREVAARLFNVLSYLVGQLQRGAELFLAPDQLVEVKPHGVVVDVGVEVEDVTLDGDGVVLVQRRPHADVGHALERAVEALEARRGDVDAAAGEELVRRVDVHRRKTDLAPEPPPGGDAALDEVRAAEGEICAADGAFGDGVAHDGARHADPSQAHVVDAAHFESGFLPGRL